MSAYIVEDRTINRVVSYVNSYLQNDHRWLFDRLLTAAETSATDPEWQVKLGVSMAMLNDIAQDARYGEGTAVKDREGHPYKFHWEQCSKIQALKSLQCWHYQCSGGNVPETSELYKVADEVIGYLAASIVSRLPEYEKAQWA